MTTEQPAADLAWRAAAHAALADPGRLAVVDALHLGDLSPGDLAVRLGMQSNLLAHHLNVLASAGLVRRVPSESDGRRSYVRLVPQSLARLGQFQTPPLPHERVVFVCSANSARSQLAAAVWADRTGRQAASAGTHPAARIHPGAVRAARAHGLRLLADHPVSTSDVLTPQDVVVTVCDSADREVTVAHTHWSIPDPVKSEKPRAFEATLAEVEQRIDGWVATAASA